MLSFFTGPRYCTDQWEALLQLVTRQAFAVPESKPNESLYQCRPCADFKRQIRTDPGGMCAVFRAAFGIVSLQRVMTLTSAQVVWFAVNTN